MKSSAHNLRPIAPRPQDGEPAGNGHGPANGNGAGPHPYQQQPHHYYVPVQYESLMGKRQGDVSLDPRDYFYPGMQPRGFGYGMPSGYGGPPANYAQGGYHYAGGGGGALAPGPGPAQAHSGPRAAAAAAIAEEKEKAAARGGSDSDELTSSGGKAELTEKEKEGRDETPAREPEPEAGAAAGRRASLDGAAPGLKRVKSCVAQTSSDAAPGPNPLLGQPVAAALQSILDYFEAEPRVPEDSRGRLVAETRRALAEVEQNGQIIPTDFSKGIL